MNRDEIRRLVRKMLADGALPRDRPGIAGTGRILMTGGTALPDPCAVCGGRPTQFRYGDPCGAGLAFDEDCHTVWEEEITKT
jgi:hypothetical protein